MKRIRYIKSPGIEIREIDGSEKTINFSNTSVYVMGFASKGEPYEPHRISSIAALEQYFGQPTNEAERYFYHACFNVLLAKGRLIAARLPYQSAIDLNYKYCKFYADNTQLALSGVSNISLEDYDALATGGNYTTEAAPFIIVNEHKSTKSGPNNDEGLFCILLNAEHGELVQQLNDGADENTLLKSITAGELSGSTFTTQLYGPYKESSESKNLMEFYPQLEYNDLETETYEERFKNIVTIAVAQTNSDINNNGELNINIIETHTGSITEGSMDNVTSRTNFLPDIINRDSKYIKMYKTNSSSDPIIINNWITDIVTPIQLLSFSEAESYKLINTTNLLIDMKRALDRVSNLNDYEIDIVLDGGLSTIAQFAYIEIPYIYEYEQCSFSYI